MRGLLVLPAVLAFLFKFDVRLGLYMNFTIRATHNLHFTCT